MVKTPVTTTRTVAVVTKIVEYLAVMPIVKPVVVTGALPGGDSWSEMLVIATLPVIRPLVLTDAHVPVVVSGDGITGKIAVSDTLLGSSQMGGGVGGGIG